MGRQRDARRMNAVMASARERGTVEVAAVPATPTCSDCGHLDYNEVWLDEETGAEFCALCGEDLEEQAEGERHDHS